MRNAVDYSDKVIKRNSLLSLGCKILSMGFSLISAPLLLHCLGDTKYGIWASILSIVSWIYYFDMGVGSGLRNKLAHFLALGDDESANKCIGTAYASIGVMSAFIFFIVFILITCLDVENLLNIHLETENLKICIGIAFLFACINFVTSLVNNIYYSTQNASGVNVFSLLGQAFFVLMLILYSVLGVETLMLVALAEGCSQLVKNIVATICVLHKNTNLKIRFSDFEWKYVKYIMSFGLQMFVVQIAALVLNSTDNLIITRLYGPQAVTPYSLSFNYFNMINSFYVVLITPFLSAYTVAYAKEDSEWIKNTLKKNALLYIVFVCGTLLAVVVFKPIMRIWLQQELLFDESVVILMALYFILLMFSHIFSTFLTGVGMVKETTIFTVIGTVVNIPASIYFADTLQLGTKGIILGTIVSMVIGIWVAPLKTIKILSRKEK